MNANRITILSGSFSTASFPGGYWFPLDFATSSQEKVIHRLLITSSGLDRFGVHPGRSRLDFRPSFFRFSEEVA